MLKALRKLTYLTAFIALTTAVCHYLFSWIGFNPTDEGFVLAASRRILDGQIPHLDFLSLRPAGSAYIHALELRFFDEPFMISRLFFWAQSAMIAWMWVVIADKLLKLEITLANRYMLSFIVLMFNVHSFPAMAWTTIDGLFLSTWGLWLLTHFNKRGNQLGYLLIGCAVLCKQNFLAVVPGAFLVMSHYKRPYYLVIGLLPSLLYGLLLWRNDALDIAMQQLLSRGELMETGIRAYATSPGFYIGLGIPVAINAFRSRFKKYLRNIDFIVSISLVILGGASLYLNLFTGEFSFLLFGFMIGYAGTHIKKRYVVIFSGMVIMIAWTVSISLGYNTPALASGVLIAALLAINYDREVFSLSRNVKYPIALVILIGLFLAFGYSRYHNVYKDNRAGNLTAELDGVLNGAAGIMTNPEIQTSFRELNELADRYGDSLAVVPDYAAFWATSEHPNPLPIDWPNIGELSDSIAQQYVQVTLDSLRGRALVAVQKYRTSELYLERRPLEDDIYQFPVIDMIETTFIRIGETEYFYLYR